MNQGPDGGAADTADVHATAPWPHRLLDVPALRAAGTAPVPFHQFVLKLNSRCNLLCHYCAASAGTRRRSGSTAASSASSPRRASTAAWDNNCALTLLDDGEAEEGLRLAEESTWQMEAAIGLDHVWSLGCAMNRTAALAAVGDLEEAERVGRDALRRAIPAMGAGHVLCANLRAALALDLRALGRMEESATLERLALNTLSASHGANHDQTRYMRSHSRPYWDFEPQPI